MNNREFKTSLGSFNQTICIKYNREELWRSLYNYRDNLDEIIALIEGNKWQNLAVILRANREARFFIL